MVYDRYGRQWLAPIPGVCQEDGSGPYFFLAICIRYGILNMDQVVCSSSNSNQT